MSPTESPTAPEPSPTTDLVVQQAQRAAVVPAPVLSGPELEATWRISKALAASGMFKDARQAEQAFAKILLGRDLGLSPTQAMTGIYLIEGRPEVGANLLAYFVKAREGYDYDVVEHSNETCTLRFTLDGEQLGVSTFTAEDAKLAKLETKDNHKKYPRNMLFARAMSNGVKWFCPEVMNGVPVYTEGELPRGHDVAGGDSTDPTSPNTIQDVPLVDEVRETIARARELGHAGLSSVATAEMTLRGQPEQRARDWLNMAKVELDGMDVEDAEVVPDEPTAERPPEDGDEAPAGQPQPEGGVPDEAEIARLELLRRAEEHDAHAEVADTEGHADVAAEHRAEAQALRDAAEVAADAEQGSLEV